MERIPEPELMVEKEQVISYDEADFSEGEVNLINQINQYLLKKNISLDEKDLIVGLYDPSDNGLKLEMWTKSCLLYTSPSPRDRQKSRMPSSA